LKNVADLVKPEIDHRNKPEVVAGNPLVGLSEAAVLAVVSRKILCLTRQPRLREEEEELSSHAQRPLQRLVAEDV
jgi:hypothetical protein